MCVIFSGYNLRREWAILFTIRVPLVRPEDSCTRIPQQIDTHVPASCSITPGTHYRMSWALNSQTPSSSVHVSKRKYEWRVSRYATASFPTLINPVIRTDRR
jgi:hypothetical protein